MTKNKIITLVFVVLAIVSLALIYIFRIRKNNKSIPVTESNKALILFYHYLWKKQYG